MKVFGFFILIFIKLSKIFNDKREAYGMPHLGIVIWCVRGQSPDCFPEGIEPFASVYSNSLSDCTFFALSFMKTMELALR